LRPYAAPFFERDEIETACKVLESGKVNYWMWDECQAFEQEYAESIGMIQAIALSNGTVALELALGIFSIGPEMRSLLIRERL
jgi:dTDP-4-amino-4,6-dideoxygalactose transaminase